MSKVCPKCGTNLEENAVFCDECGERLAAPTAQPVNNAAGNMSKGSEKQSGMGIASLVLGIISILTLGVFIFPEIVGLVLGIIGILDKTHKKTLAIVGTVLSGIAIVIIVFSLILAGISEM